MSREGHGPARAIRLAVDEAVGEAVGALAEAAVADNEVPEEAERNREFARSLGIYGRRDRRAFARSLRKRGRGYTKRGA